MERVKLRLGNDNVHPALSGNMQFLQKRSGIGDLLIDLNPLTARRLGPLGLSLITAAIGAFVAWAVLWGFAHAGILQRNLTILDLPIVIGAFLGARNGWNAWRHHFGV